LSKGALLSCCLFVIFQIFKKVGFWAIPFQVIRTCTKISKICCWWFFYFLLIFIAVPFQRTESLIFTLETHWVGTKNVIPSLMEKDKLAALYIFVRHLAASTKKSVRIGSSYTKLIFLKKVFPARNNTVLSWHWCLSFAKRRTRHWSIS
jgi:hypothetical protein